MARAAAEVRFPKMGGAVPVGAVDFGVLRRVRPISPVFGLDRGQPIDRWYIERFLEEQAGLIRGRVLEIAESTYTRRFGGDHVVQSDVLHAVPGNPQATLVGDLTRPEDFAPAAFDCVVCTQTLPFIFDVPAALRGIWRMLKPGGALLATVPGISQISRYDFERWGDYWRFTTMSVRRLIAENMPGAQADVWAHGNVLAAVSLLMGLAVEDVTAAELDAADPDYEVIITMRVIKPAAAEC